MNELPDSWMKFVIWLVKQFGPTTSVVLGLLIYYHLQEAGAVPSKQKEAVELLRAQSVAQAHQDRQIGELAKAITALTSTIEDRERRRDQTLRDMWCYATVRDKEVLKLCTKAIVPLEPGPTDRR